jgi:hypothetical protein
MEGPTKKDKLIAALKVSGLRTTLWNTYTFLQETGDSDFECIFGCQLTRTMHALSSLIDECDGYLNYYVGNFKGERNYENVRV